jgi:ABC-type iron transport system FetAB permease component
MKFGFPKMLVPTESEVRANHAGMNTFFGAVLGFVMAGTERLDAIEFACILFLVSGVVISVLYVSASPYKFVYAVATLVFIAMLPGVAATVLDKGEHLPDKLQPTLLVWTFLSIFVEFFPRRPDDPPATEP